MSTTEESRVTAVTPLKLTGLVCVVISLCLDVVALLSPAWVTADGHFSLSLWLRCFRASPLPDADWHCKWALDSGKQRVSLPLSLSLPGTAGGSRGPGRGGWGSVSVTGWTIDSEFLTGWRAAEMLQELRGGLDIRELIREQLRATEYSLGCEETDK